ncbi:hypothetical protein Tco_0341331 [Tanacetum coccineum]
MPRECLKIIKSKSKVRQSRSKAVVAKVSTSSSTLAVSSDVAELKDMVRALILDKKSQTPAPAPVKAVKQSCVTQVTLLITQRSARSTLLEVYNTSVRTANNAILAYEAHGKQGLITYLSLSITLSLMVYIYYNRKDKENHETMMVTFDDFQHMHYEQTVTKPGLQSILPGQKHSGRILLMLRQQYQPQKPTEGVSGFYCSSYYDDFICGQPSSAQELSSACSSTSSFFGQLQTATTTTATHHRHQ